MKLTVDLNTEHLFITTTNLNKINLKEINKTLDGNYLLIDFIYRHEEDNVEYYHDGIVSELSDLDYIDLINVSGDFHFKAKFKLEYDYIKLSDYICITQEDVEFIKLSNYNRKFDESQFNTVEDKRTLENFVYNSFKNEIIELIQNSEIEVHLTTKVC